ncbi:hypothetical protein BU24DRAFT_342963 [Aaosphaeria arxii CBS 175.79]|uniref:Transcription factor domain-containing protein n=1 Tax=Aaosphaeria arxii CBS 175.79 TaxID=1450172 RepID=A0A6A5Y3J4_9PLEO|nr:uncharacterized protein BU24DRAFT_342963 [Aaosphaeria arxii CBS 175.79]KAF2019607.1 hypothetical protein BU24DRAFT_342963 [Aaosphaeria arxii CBS 175.79]
MESSGSQERANKGGRRSGKKPQPMKFMFIDSSDHGVNAKPDKAVRSFVMHQARRSKPWSTRMKASKSPPADDEDNEAPYQGFAPHETQSAGESSFLNFEYWSSSDTRSPDARSALSLVSPVSSGRNSRNSSLSTNSRRSSRAHVVSRPRHRRGCDNPDCRGIGCLPSPTISSRQDGFALGTMDPFDSLPVQTDHKMSSLLEHFVSIISPRLVPVDLHQSSLVANAKWVVDSLKNATSAPYIYAVITTSALQLQSMGVLDNSDTLRYKILTIAAIHKLMNDTRAQINDDNIAAVFMLLCLEESQIIPGTMNPDYSDHQRAWHRRGLTNMIDQRGGLSSFSSNRNLQIFLLMHSMAHSISTFQPPYAVLLDGNGRPQSYDLPTFRQRPSSARVLRAFRDLKLDDLLQTIIGDIVVFTGDLSAWYEDSKCPVDPLELQKHSCLLQYRLFTWYSEALPLGEERNPIDQSVCLALIIFLVKTSQPFDPSYRAMIVTTVKKLRESLARETIFRWAKSQELLLWTLTLGEMAAQGSSQAGSFFHYCPLIFPDTGLDNKPTAQELLDRMKKCLWVPMLFDDEVSRLWIKMGVAKGAQMDGADGAGMLSPQIDKDDVVGLMTNTRFFSEKQSTSSPSSNPSPPSSHTSPRAQEIHDTHLL